MSEFTPIVNFPNFIYIPKIVPLVYDDVLSYYEFLNKVLVKLNEVIDDVNDLGVDVDELKTNVERLAGLIDGFDDRITANEAAIQTLNAAVQAVEQALNSALVDLRAVEAKNEQQDTRISAIETQITTDIAAAVAALQAELSEVSADVTTLESQVDNNTGRIAVLEEATLEAPITGNSNIILTGDMQNLDVFDYSIEKLETTYDNDNIEVVDGLIRFYAVTSTNRNQCALVIKNVLPYYGGNPYNNKILSFGNRYKLNPGSSNGVDYASNITFQSLTGSTPYIASTDYTSTRASMRVLQLKRSGDTKYYDLWIYNNYNGQYPILTGGNVDFLNICMAWRGFTAQDSTDTRKNFFIQAFNAGTKQISRIIDKVKPGILQAAQDSASHMDDIMATQLRDYALDVSAGVQDLCDQFDQEYVDRSSVAYNDEDYCSFNEIQNLNSDVSVDYSDCRYGKSSWEGVTSALSHWEEELRIWINIELTISGASAVNTANSLPVLNISNTLGASISKMIPLAAHCALPAKAPFVEAYLHTNGNILFRLWFDDTGYNYTDNPITVRISGYIPLPYTVNEPT